MYIKVHFLLGQKLKKCLESEHFDGMEYLTSGLQGSTKKLKFCHHLHAYMFKTCVTFSFVKNNLWLSLYEKKKNTIF